MMIPAWILLVALYGIIKGARDIVKKKALEKSAVLEVLFFYTLIGFVVLLPDTKTALQLEPKLIGYIFVKSFIIFVAWICSFHAIKKMPISLYGIMDMSRVLFATILGITVLEEVFSKNRIIGFLLVLVGLLFVNLKKTKVKEKVDKVSLVIVLISCFFNAVSELLDKVLMQQMESAQLQYWYMLFMLILYLIAMLAKKMVPDIRIVKNNLWIVLLSILFIIGDRALFIANQSPDSNVLVITLIKQCSVLVTILGGKLVYKEKNIGFKLFCAGLILLGIVIALL